MNRVTWEEPDPVRWRRCDGKRAYDTKEQARRASHWKKPLRAYKCPYLLPEDEGRPHFHVGHRRSMRERMEARDVTTKM
jgi:hypothetical protein